MSTPFLFERLKTRFLHLTEASMSSLFVGCCGSLKINALKDLIKKAKLLLKEN